MELMLNEVLGGFELVNRVGAGGMGGEVWLATHPRYPGQRFAVKRFREDAVLDPESLESEKRGAELQKRLAEIAPQVPKVYAIGQEAGYFYVAMEFIEGNDLATVVAGGRIEERRAAQIAIQLCFLLEQAERVSYALPTARAVVHGDIKPENIRLQEGDEVRVLDFGIAKPIASDKTHTINVFGSVPYLSPERAREGKVDGGADLWAVAVVLYKMVQGRNPYGGETTGALLESMRQRKLDFSAPVSRGMEEILRKALDLDRRRRYNSAARLRADLETFCSSGDFHVQSYGSEGHQEAVTRKTTSAASMADEEPRSARRAAVMARPGKWGVMVLILLGVIGAWSGFVKWKVREIQREVAMATSLQEALALNERVRSLERFVPDEALAEVREPLLYRLEDLANAAVAKTQDEISRMDESDWQLAFDGFKGVLGLGEDSDDVRSRMHYCKAQLSRLQGMAKIDEGSMDEGRKLLRRALDDFREADRLSSQPWPQPGLGEAQILALPHDRGGWASADDILKVYQGAEKAGHELAGEDRLLIGLAYLREAEESFKVAIGLDPVGEWGDRVANLQQTRESVNQAAEYLSVVNSPVEAPPEAMRKLTDIRCRTEEELRRHGIYEAAGGGC